MVVNMKVLRVIPFVTTILIMVVIFGFSSQKSETSAAVSRGLTQKVVNVLPIVRHMSPEKKQDIVKMIHNAVRKGAHFTLYALLGISSAAMFAVLFPSKGRLYVWLMAIGFSFVYAASDEFHQLFVPGRGGQIRDVMIDTAGAVTGGGIYFALRYILHKLRCRLRRRSIVNYD